MKIDIGLEGGVRRVEAEAASAAAIGFDGLWAAETTHDPFLLASRALVATETATVGTGVAIAFARSPMTVATSAHDLAVLSEGRFILGLGSQVQAHIERRFAMPWSKPAARMRDFILALHAIWDNWDHQTPLRHDGEFYRFDLMTPFFTPRFAPSGRPPVFLAGVGPLMTRVAGEVADGYIFHAFTSVDYLTQVTLPALERGAADRVLPQPPVVSGPVLIATGADDEELERSRRATAARIAFYASTPAYRAVLDHHGWEGVHEILRQMSRDGRWDDMADQISDEMIDTFAVQGDPTSVGEEIARRFAGLASRVTLYSPARLSEGTAAQVASGVRSAAPVPSA